MGSGLGGVEITNNFVGGAIGGNECACRGIKSFSNGQRCRVIGEEEFSRGGGEEASTKESGDAITDDAIEVEISVEL